MSVGPSSRPHQAMWWMSQAENTTVQSGCAQLRCMARNARRWARVAVRRLRPTSRTSPAPFSTIGRMSASQHIRRTVSTGNGMPSSVSQMLWACQPDTRVSWSTSTLISGTRSPGPPEVAAITASTCNCAHGVRALPSCCRSRRSLGVDRRVQCGVTDRVQLEMGVMHPGRLVDPPLHARPRPLVVPTPRRHCRVGSPRGGGTGPGTAARTVSTLECGGCLQQEVLVGEELRPQVLVQTARGVSERIDMTSRHHTSNESIFEAVRRFAHPVTFGDRGSVLAGASPGDTEQRLRRRCRARCSQLAAATGAPHLERIQPTA